MSDSLETTAIEADVVPQTAFRDRLKHGVRLLLVFWPRKARSRLALRELDDHLLRDIGLSRTQAKREAEKPFWR
ncbi:DUF1127 domain-containing protein [Agrobacterium sp. ES01]|uniref:DUF1127 domain-containing protein n=1 Tax=Agrobacterium sp. ES01 TaxID=3420714 RepID=UPI003D0CC923